MKRILVLLLVFCTILGFASCKDEKSSGSGKGKDLTLGGSFDYSKYEGDRGVEISGRFKAVSNQYIDVRVKNTSSKKITVAKFYSVSYDAYGEFICDNFFDLGGKEIQAGDGLLLDMISVYHFKGDQVLIPSKVDIYAYNVYFEDGTEWGNRNAKKEEITDCCSYITIDNNSEINW